MTRRNYNFTVLRYVHDPLSGEFANVGLALFSPGQLGEKSIIRSRMRRTIGRLRDMFPDLDRRAFVYAMQSIDRAFAKASKRPSHGELSLERVDALTFAKSVLPLDDSSLQWSPLGSGIASSIDEAFESLFERYVTRYDTKSAYRRSDEEVWRPVRQRLLDRNILVELAPKVIESSDDKVEFQHAWKNGAWHVYEPLSLDLADSEGIYRKAHRWLGQLASVVPGATEQFHTHFIVGAPADPNLEKAYSNALRILSKAPGNVEIFEEKEIDRLVSKIEDEVRSHG